MTFRNALYSFPAAAGNIGSVTSAAEWEALDGGHIVLATTVLCAIGTLTPAEAMAPVEALAAMAEGHAGHRVALIHADLARVRELIGTFDAAGFAARIAGSLRDLRIDESREEYGAWVRSHAGTGIADYEKRHRDLEARLIAESAVRFAALSRAAHAAAPWSLIGPALAAARWAERVASAA